MFYCYNFILCFGPTKAKKVGIGKMCGCGACTVAVAHGLILKVGLRDCRKWPIVLDKQHNRACLTRDIAHPPPPPPPPRTPLEHIGGSCGNFFFKSPPPVCQFLNPPPPLTTYFLVDMN